MGEECDMERRTTTNRARLTLERLDERIVPSHGTSDHSGESHGVALGHWKQEVEDEATRWFRDWLADYAHDVREMDSAAAKAKNVSSGKSALKHGDHENKSDES